MMLDDLVYPDYHDLFCKDFDLLSSDEMVTFSLKASYIHTIQKVFENLSRDRKELEILMKKKDKISHEKMAIEKRVSVMRKNIHSVSLLERRFA